jgi:hypothetical protein
MSNEAQQIDETDQSVEEAWALEIERRARRVLAGESTGTDWAEVRARLGLTPRPPLPSPSPQPGEGEKNSTLFTV